MEHFPTFQAQDVDSAKPGTFYGFMNGGKLYLGFRITPPPHLPQAFVSLTPGSPQFGSRPGIVFAENFGPKSLIAFSDARVRLPFDAEAAQTLPKAEDIAGSVVLIDGTLAIAAFFDRGDCRFFDLTNGAMVERKERFRPYFPVWSIETKDADGSWKTLRAFNFADAGAKPAMQ
jgi:hypothetical protein